MNRRIITLLAMGAAGAVAFSVPGLAGPGYKNQYPTKTLTTACPDDDNTDDLVTYNGPTQLWPPNHKLQDTLLVAQGDSDDNPVTLRVTGAVDDVAGGDGGPNHDPDIFFNPMVVEEDGPVGYDGDSEAGRAEVTVSLRAERSGKSGPDGMRTYTLDWTADFPDGEGDCTGTINVVVPHDMSERADREGRINGNK